jgi:hypothetical protein
MYQQSQQYLHTWAAALGLVPITFDGTMTAAEKKTMPKQ